MFQIAWDTYAQSEVQGQILHSAKVCSIYVENSANAVGPI